MGLNDFWLQLNNGKKKYNLKDLKDIKANDIAKNSKLQKFISFFDLDGSGSIEIKNKNGENEWQSIFTELKKAAVDDDLSNEEFGLYISKKMPDENLKLEDINELLDIATGEINQEEIPQTERQPEEDFTADAEAIQVIGDTEINKIKNNAYGNVITSTFTTEPSERDYENIYDFAMDKLSKSGKQPTFENLFLFVTELQFLNPELEADKQIKKGTSVNLLSKSIDKKNLELLKSKGIKVEKNNYIFFQKLLELDDEKQALVFDVIKNSKFNTKEEILNEIYNKTKINLTDSELVINAGGVSSTLENFITKTLKLDLSSKDGLKIYDRLSCFNQEVLDNLPEEFIDKLSKMNGITFDKLADKAETFGIILRTDKEINEREKNSQEYRDLRARIFMAQYAANNYTSAVSISQDTDRNLNFTQGTWWVRNSRPINYTSNEQQKRDAKKAEQLRELIQNADTLSNEEFAKRMSTIMEAERTVNVSALSGDLPVSHNAKDLSFKFDPKLAYTFMKQTQKAEIAAEVDKMVQPKIKQKEQNNSFIAESTRVYNAKLELMGTEYTVEQPDKAQLEMLKSYIELIDNKKELFSFAKSLHYKTNDMDNRVETMIPKENQAEIQSLLEKKAKELGFAEPTNPNNISLDTFRNIFAKPIDKKLNYPKTNDKTILETYEATKTKLLGSWDPVGEQIRANELEGAVGGTLDIATMILVTKGMGSLKTFAKIANVGRNIGSATNLYKTSNVAARFTKNKKLLDRLAKADKVMGNLWINGTAGALHGAATMGAYGGLQGVIGMADNTVKNLLEGKHLLEDKKWYEGLAEGLGERFEQTLLMGYENAKFGLFAGYAGVLSQALGKGTYSLGAKGIDKLFKTNYSKTVLDKVSNIVTEEGISGSEFYTKMHAASKTEDIIGIAFYETTFYALYRKLEEAGVDFNDENALYSAIEENLDDETKEAFGVTYLKEGGNLALFKTIGSLIQWIHIGKMSSAAAIELQAKNNRALKNMSIQKVTENGKDSYIVKFNENDKPTKYDAEKLLQVCEQKMFCADVEDKVQKDGSFKLPDGQTIEYDKTKKVYRTVIDKENTVESASVENLLAQVNFITFKNNIDKQLSKDKQVELEEGIKLTKTDETYQIKISLKNGKELLLKSEDLENILMQVQVLKLTYDISDIIKTEQKEQTKDMPVSEAKPENVPQKGKSFDTQSKNNPTQTFSMTKPKNYITSQSKGKILNDAEAKIFLEKLGFDEKTSTNFLFRLKNPEGNYNQEILDFIKELKESDFTIHIARKLFFHYDQINREMSFNIPSIDKINDIIDCISQIKTSGADDLTIVHIVDCLKTEDGQLNDNLININSFETLNDFYNQFNNNIVAIQSDWLSTITNLYLTDNSGKLNDKNIKFVKDILQKCPENINILKYARDENGVCFDNTSEIIDYASEKRKNFKDEFEVNLYVKYLRDKNGRLNTKNEEALEKALEKIENNHLKRSCLDYLLDDNGVLSYENLDSRIDELIRLHHTFGDENTFFKGWTDIIYSAIESPSRVAKYETLKTIGKWIDKNYPQIFVHRLLGNKKDKLTPEQIKVIDDIIQQYKDYDPRILLVAFSCKRDCYQEFDNLFKKLKNSELPKNIQANVLKACNATNIKIAEQLCFDKNFPQEKLQDFLNSVNSSNVDFIKILLKNENLYKELIDGLNNIDKNFSYSELLSVLEIKYTQEKIGNNNIDSVILTQNIKKLGNIPKSELYRFLEENPKITPEEISVITDKIIQIHKNTNISLNVLMDKIDGDSSIEKLNILSEIISIRKFASYETGSFFEVIQKSQNKISKEQLNLFKDILSNYKDETNNEHIFLNVLKCTFSGNSYNALNDFYIKLKNSSFDNENQMKLLQNISESNIALYSAICFDNKLDFTPEEIIKITKEADKNNEKILLEILEKCKEKQIDKKTFFGIINRNEGKKLQILEHPFVKQIFFDNLEKAPFVNNSISSDNYIELHFGSTSYNIKLDNETTGHIIGEEHTMSKTGVFGTEYKTTDGSVKIEQYSGIPGFNNTNGTLETIKDAEGKIVSRTITKPSKRNPGVLVVIREIYDKDGNVTEVKNIGFVKQYGSNRQGRRIEREYTSPGGTVEKQIIIEGPKGRYSKFEVDGKVFERRSRKIDDNTIESKVWENTYTAKYSADKIEISVSRKDGTVETVVLDSNQIDLTLMPLYKNIPTDYLYILAKTGTKVEIDKKRTKNAYFSPSGNKIGISKELINDPFTFAHEFGHMLDDMVLNKLNSDSNLKAIFIKELENYKAQSTRFNEMEISYFVAKDHVNADGCLTEVIAEANAILSGVVHDSNFLLLRAKLLQENFPETLSYIGTKIQEAMKGDITTSIQTSAAQKTVTADKTAAMNAQPTEVSSAMHADTPSARRTEVQAKQSSVSQFDVLVAEVDNVTSIEEINNMRRKISQTKFEYKSQQKQLFTKLKAQEQNIQENAVLLKLGTKVGDNIDKHSIINEFTRESNLIKAIVATKLNNITVFYEIKINTDDSGNVVSKTKTELKNYKQNNKPQKTEYKPFDYTYGYSDDRIAYDGGMTESTFDVFRKHLYPDLYGTYEVKGSVAKGNSNAVYEKVKHIDTNNNRKPINLAPFGDSSIRGRNLLTLSPQIFDEFKANGIKCLIDLRAEASDKEKIKEVDGKKYINGIEYIHIPMDYSTGKCDYEIIQNLAQYFNAIDNGNVYIGCNLGSHRTDFAIALNYALNTKTKEASPMLYLNMNDIVSGVRRVYKKIMNMTPEELKANNVSDELLNIMPKNVKELETRLKRIADVTSETK